ncbi:MAG TPA: patatin-like phospholipase family protein [Actinoplanes sp.]|nr:patatin-like phospholipase family protein [Actinoplanes sp.]
MKTRVGLVLGGGGTLGAAWMIGGLPAVQERIGRPLQDADVIVGTSAGSVVAAALRHGLGPDDLIAHQDGTAGAQLPGPEDFDRDSGRLPPPPRLRMGSVRLLAAAAMAPHTVHPMVAASALVPQGRARHQTLHRYVQSMVTAHRGDPDSWPEQHTWIVGVDYESGRRTVFGRTGAPPARLADAVVASCSIPGWHRPMAIGPRRYVDGGVRSAASVDVLHREMLDHVYVLAPMVSHRTDRPLRPSWQAERLVRQALTGQLNAEVRKVAAGGAHVTVITPGPEDLRAMGGNLMDGRRRREVLETARVTVPAALAAA